MIRILALAFLIQGCTYGVYQNGPVKIQRFGFATDVDLAPAEDKSDKFGNHSVKIGGLSSNQTEAVGKAVEGAVTAIMKGAP